MIFLGTPPPSTRLGIRCSNNLYFAKFRLMILFYLMAIYVYVEPEECLYYDPSVYVVYVDDTVSVFFQARNKKLKDQLNQDGAGFDDIEKLEYENRKLKADLDKAKKVQYLEGMNR